MIIAIDTETGGLDSNKNALLSISACFLDNPKKTFNVFIEPAPDTTIEPEAAAVNGYTPEEWKKRGAVPLLTALQKFKAWLPYSGNEPLAHNAPFDKGFIEAAEKRANFNLYLKKRWRCSMALFMGVNDALRLNSPDFKLVTLAGMAGHGTEFQKGTHQSLDDVIACAAGWKWLIERIRHGDNPADLAPPKTEAKV